MKPITSPNNTQLSGASFRDPSGFLFISEGVLYRQVNRAYQENYEMLVSSGLYQSLVDAGLLIPHDEVAIAPADPQVAYKIIKPEQVTFISYPYEWSFSQLKDAALTTLAIQKKTLGFGMTLKDSSAYNIQFHHGRVLMIDSLSFEQYQEGQPWTPYRQFCQHFLAPLSLMAHRDIRLNQLLKIYIDGIPLDLASKLLPWRTRFSLPLFLNIHTHAKSQKRYASQSIETSRQMSKLSLLGLIDNLESGIRGLRWSPSGTDWGDYYEQDHNYTQAGFTEKQRIVASLLDTIQPKTAWDLGANTGLFSRLASSRGISTIAFDIDPGAVDRNYQECRATGESNLLPLLIDLTSPSPSIGWNNRERSSMLERAPADVIIALALVHHLAISNNVPLDRLASFFQQLGIWLVIEFIPKSDSQVRRLLVSRADIFPNYTRENFEESFSAFFKIHRKESIPDSERCLYLMERL
ncbi:MAG: hypothetical protein A2W33_08080 [Chloroflexi bacterium RBG_16_52_11]|nr:MAG: hypothetical protein A2W33_08080 [Chloroflexi bacterium RBG_16_52_11]